MRRFATLLILVVLLCGGAYAWARWYPLPLPERDYAFDVKPGSSLRSVARELQSDGVVPSDWTLIVAARLMRADRAIKAGNYALAPGVTLLGLLAKLTQGDMTQSAFTIVDGWTVRELRLALASRSDVRMTLDSVSDADLILRLGATEPGSEGWFFPDTYFYAAGSTDVSILARAYKRMKERLALAWSARAPGLPLEQPLQALILASIVEKETGRAADRPLVAAVFINRLRQGMRLQTDPTVIYGLGERFDGTLHRRDLDNDHPFNTYTRDGLPPAPICLPGQASLDAVLHPPSSPYLYFVARGDGSSEFSTNLADHNRAVARYQKHAR